jgi:hypothetical protein
MIHSLEFWRCTSKHVLHIFLEQHLPTPLGPVGGGGLSLVHGMGNSSLPGQDVPTFFHCLGKEALDFLELGKQPETCGGIYSTFTGI